MRKALLIAHAEAFLRCHQVLGANVITYGVSLSRSDSNVREDILLAVWAAHTGHNKQNLKPAFGLLQMALINFASVCRFALKLVISDMRIKPSES